MKGIRGSFAAYSRLIRGSLNSITARSQLVYKPPRLREAAREEVIARLLDYAEKIEGLYRNASTHAAGVVIGDRPLDRLVCSECLLNRNGVDARIQLVSMVYGCRRN